MDIAENSPHGGPYSSPIYFILSLPHLCCKLLSLIHNQNLQFDTPPLLPFLSKGSKITDSPFRDMNSKFLSAKITQIFLSLLSIRLFYYYLIIGSKGTIWSAFKREKDTRKLKQRQHQFQRKQKRIEVCVQREKRGGYRTDEVRGSKETFGAPEGIVEVSSMPFELRRETAVDNGNAT